MPIIDMGYLLNGALLSLVGALIGWIIGSARSGVGRETEERREERKREQAKQEAMEQGMRELLYWRLSESFDKAVSQGYTTPDEFQQMQSTYAAYHTLGGNGRGTKLWDEYQELPIRH